MEQNCEEQEVAAREHTTNLLEGAKANAIAHDQAEALAKIDELYELAIGRYVSKSDWDFWDWLDYDEQDRYKEAYRTAHGEEAFKEEFGWMEDYYDDVMSTPSNPTPGLSRMLREGGL